MNLQEISALAEKKLGNTSAHEEIRAFKNEHLALLNESGLNFDPEIYKYTNLNKFLENIPLPFTVNSSPKEEDQLENLPTFLFIDGELKKSPLINGLAISLLNEKFNLVSETLNKEGAASNLHHSLLSDGIILDFPKNFNSDLPIRVLHLITNNDIIAPTLIIRVGENAELTLIEETKGSASAYVQIGESYIHMERGAKLEHIILSRGQTESIHHNSFKTELKRDASYKNFIFHLDGKLIRSNLEIKLLESGSNGENYSLFMSNTGEHMDINTVINHLAPDTTSNQIAKGILGGDSKGVFTGKIHIHPRAQRVSSGQLNKNLLLSPKAHIYSQPQLEIFADDVKCSHGSTTGQLSPEEIFYFESRGLPPERAATLLAHGFGLEIVFKIKNIKLRDKIAQIILNSLKSKFNIGENL